MELLRSLGHEVTEALPATAGWSPTSIPLYFRGIRDEALTLPHPERLSDQTKGFVRLGRLFSDRAPGEGYATGWPRGSRPDPGGSSGTTTC